MIPKMKHTLRFREDGSFRILMVSDLQDKLEYDPRTLAGFDAIVEAAKPDLVILGGDNVDGRKLKPYDEFIKYMEIFTAPLEKRKIPWMHVFGKHDYDVDVSGEEQQEVYESYPYCISSHSEGIPGITNYMVPILAHDSDRVEYAVYAFDSHYKDRTRRPGVSHEDLMLPNREPFYKKWEPIYFEQQMWYWNLSKELEAQEGHTVRAMAVMHVPPHEIMMAVNNPTETGYIGAEGEKWQCPMVNSGVFSTMLERGDVEIIAAGHLHHNISDGVYGGIRFTLDACGGFAIGGVDERRGGRIFDIRTDGTHETRMIYAKDYIDISKK